MKLRPEDTTVVVRQSVERACRDFTARVAPLGFARTKKMIWARRHDYSADFIYFQRSGSTYGRPLNYSVSIRVHFGIRVLNDVFEGPILNGPSNEGDWDFMRAGRFHHRFNAKTGSTYERCIDDLTRYVIERGEPWFWRFREPTALLSASDSPLRDSEKEGLRVALDGHTDPEVVGNSLKILGIKIKKTSQK